MLVNNKASFSHNHLPYECAKYVQTLFNPFKEKQFITVATVIRTNYIPQDEELAATLAKTVSRKSCLIKGNKKSVFKHHVLESKGPLDTKQLMTEDSDDFDFLGNKSSEWKSSKVYEPLYPELEQQEYLVIAVWSYDEEKMTIKCLKEETVYNPVSVKNNTRPVHISTQCKCLFYFDRDENRLINYCELALDSIDES